MPGSIRMGPCLLVLMSRSSIADAIQFLIVCGYKVIFPGLTLCSKASTSRSKLFMYSQESSSETYMGVAANVSAVEQMHI